MTLNKELYDTLEPVYAQSQGSYQKLDNGHVMMAHGAVPKVAEFDESGNCIMRVWFGHEGATSAYRVFRSSWIGTPDTKLSIVACPNDGGIVVHVSWNGATDIKAWEVSTGLDGDSLQETKTVPRDGFETKVQLEDTCGKVAVKAVGGPYGGVKSRVVTVGDGCSDEA